MSDFKLEIRAEELVLSMQRAYLCEVAGEAIRHFGVQEFDELLQSKGLARTMCVGTNGAGSDVFIVYRKEALHAT